MSRFRFASRLIRSEDGATAVEYGLILALVVLGSMTALVAMAGQVATTWNNIANKVSAVI